MTENTALAPRWLILCDLLRFYYLLFVEVKAD